LVDGEAGVTDPVGMHGAQLEVDMHVIHGKTNRLQNSIRLIRDTSLEVAENNAGELKNIVKAHAETVQQASVNMRNRLWESEELSRRIKSRLEDSMGEWSMARDDFARERLNLEKERKELAARAHLRDTIYIILILLGAVAFGMLLEYGRQH
jgi:NAD-specific glutamate dehydrogenase